MTIEVRYKKSFGDFKLDVDCRIPDHGFTVLFGPSGTGKSTLLNCIAGIEKAEQSFLKTGSIILDDSRNNLYTPVHQRRMGYVFQDNNLFPHLNVQQNLDYPLKRNRKRTQKFSLQDVISAFKIEPLLTQMPHHLSGGQKQRVALARAILSQPELLILDEPISALDFSAKQALMPYLQAIHEDLNIPVIYVSHDLREIFQLGDYILIMDQGRIIDQGRLMDLCLTQPLLTQQEGSSFILQGDVCNIDQEESISQLNIGGETFILTGTQWEKGQSLRMLIHASDVSLSLSPAADSSILNIIAAEITEINSTGNGKYLVKLRFANNTILSMISHYSKHRLQLETGMNIYAQIKATAIIR